MDFVTTTHHTYIPLPSSSDDLIIEGGATEEEILSALSVPPGKMGCIISRRGPSIFSIKESCDAEFIIGGPKGPPDKVFIIGPVKQVKKAEAILRGKMVEKCILRIFSRVEARRHKS